MVHLVFEHPRPGLDLRLHGFRISGVPSLDRVVRGKLHKVAIGGSPNLASREEEAFDFEVTGGKLRDFPLHSVYLVAPNSPYAFLEVEESDLPLLYFEAQISEVNRLGKAAEFVLLTVRVGGTRIGAPDESRMPRAHR